MLDLVSQVNAFERLEDPFYFTNVSSFVSKFAP